jgi:hypothetical protein
MAAVFHDKSFLKDLKEALGIPGEVTKIILEVETNSLIKVSTEFLLNAEQANNVRSLLGDKAS